MNKTWIAQVDSGIVRRVGLGLVLLVLIQIGLQPAGAVSSTRDRSASLSPQDWAAIQSDLPLHTQTYLKASNTGGDDRFGKAVAVDGDTVVIGAPYEDSAATGVNGDQTDNSAESAGAVYVFVRTGTTWSQQAYLKASNAGAHDGFGGAVAIDGDTLVVGASGEDSAATGVNGDQQNNSAESAGAVYVFERSGPEATPVWSQQAYLKASNPDPGDRFGYALDIHDHFLVVGTPYEDSAATGVDGDPQNNSAESAGAVYVFERSGWSQEAYLKASNAQADDQFGAAVAVYDHTIVVGAPGEDSEAAGVDGDQANNSASNAGAAYLFEFDDSWEEAGWSQQAYLKALYTCVGENFGAAVAIFNETIVVGAPREDSQAWFPTRDTFVYVFEYDGYYVYQAIALVNPSTDDYIQDWFGHSVAVEGDTIVVGAPMERAQANEASGAMYLFKRLGAYWHEQGFRRTASNADQADRFGEALAISEATIIAGIHLEDSAALGVNGNQADNSATDAGAVYAFDPALLPLSMTASSGSPQSALINTFFDDPLQVTVRDAGGKPVSGGFVFLDAPTSGASGFFETSWINNTTDSNGQVNILFASNSIPGSYTVTASLSESDTAPVSFALTNLSDVPDSPATITATGGTPQSALMNAAFDHPLQVTVRDAGGNPIAGVDVTFSAPASGASGTFPNGSIAATDAKGQVSVPFYANALAGAYVVTANLSPGVAAPASFALTNRSYQLYVAQIWGR